MKSLRRLAVLTSMLILTTMLGAVFASAASAASIWEMEIERISPSPVLSGEPVEFSLSFQCSAVDEAVCINSVLTIPLPAEILSTTVSAHPEIVSIDEAGGILTIVLSEQIDVGTSVQLRITQQTSNGTTPDGFTWDMVATMTSDNTPTVTSQDNASVSATANLGINKDLAIEDDALLDLPVRYYLDPCNPNGGETTGQLFLELAEVIDTLPANTVFVEASPGGTYDAGTHAVTWAGLTDVNNFDCADSVRGEGALWVDIIFPSSDFTLVSTAMNSATVSGTAYGDPGVIYAETITVTHGFTTPNPSTSFFKSAETYYAGSEAVVPAGVAGHYLLSQTNNGNVPIEFMMADHLPCIENSHESPALGTGCTDVAFIATSVTADSYVPTAARPVTTLDYITLSGATGSIVGMEEIGGDPELLGWDLTAIGEPVVEISFGPEVTWPIEPTKTANIHINGSWAEDVPAGAVSPGTTILNRGTFETQYEGGVIDSATDPTEVGIVIREILIGIQSFNSSELINITGTNYSADDLTGVTMTDLLPVGITISNDPLLGGEGFSISVGDRKLQYDSGTEALEGDAIDYTLVVIDDYNGTGRQLVKITINETLFPTDQTIFTFSTEGQDNLPVGDTPNTVQIFLNSVVVDGCKANSGDPAVSPLTADTNDLDGDSVTSGDNFCEASAPITNDLITAFFSSINQVKGDADPDFQSFPTVGSVDAGSGEFKFGVVNEGNVGLNNWVIYDILPHVGDSGVSGTQGDSGRESAWDATFTGMTSVPDDAVVEYSASYNPCRTEVSPEADATCTDDWSTVAPANVAALRITFPGITLNPGDSRMFSFSVSAPVGTGSGEVAWNTAAVYAEDVIDSSPLLATEPAKVGMAVPLSDISIIKGIGTDVDDLVDSLETKPGLPIDFVIVVQHDGEIEVAADGSVTYIGPPSTAKNVVLHDILPEGMTIIAGSSTTEGPVGSVPSSFDEETGIWTVGDISPSQEFVLRYSVEAPTEPRTYVNTVEVIANDTTDVDSIPNNGPVEGEDDYAVAKAVVPGPAIEVAKLVESSRDSGIFLEANSSADTIGSYLANQPVLYRFVVTNIGTEDLINVELTDSLVGTVCDQTIGALAAGASTTIDCDWTNGWGSGPVENTATVTANPSFDPATTIEDTDVAIVDITLEVIEEGKTPTPPADDLDTPEELAFTGAWTGWQIVLAFLIMCLGHLMLRSTKEVTI